MNAYIAAVSAIIASILVYAGMAFCTFRWGGKERLYAGIMEFVAGALFTIALITNPATVPDQGFLFPLFLLNVGAFLVCSAPVMDMLPKLRGPYNA